MSKGTACHSRQPSAEVKGLEPTVVGALCFQKLPGLGHPILAGGESVIASFLNFCAPHRS